MLLTLSVWILAQSYRIWRLIVAMRRWYCVEIAPTIATKSPTCRLFNPHLSINGCYNRPNYLLDNVTIWSLLMHKIGVVKSLNRRVPVMRNQISPLRSSNLNTRHPCGVELRHLSNPHPSPASNCETSSSLGLSQRTHEPDWAKFSGATYWIAICWTKILQHNFIL